MNALTPDGLRVADLLAGQDAGGQARNGDRPENYPVG
jgi:hypothetical protein